MFSERGPLNILFFEIVQMMGMRGYNIQPFKWLIDVRMRNDRLIELGRMSEVSEVPDDYLVEWISNYRMVNYDLGNDLFQGDKIRVSMVFQRYGIEDECMTTLVVISDVEKGMTSKDEVVTFIESRLTPLTLKMTNGLSREYALKSNKISGILILKNGISAYSKTFLNEMPTIKILTENDVLSRCYDQVLQSGITVVGKDIKDSILEPVGLNDSKIPSVSRDNDAYCRVMDLTKGNLMIISREALASEEPLGDSLNFRVIK